jgi:uncharacterized phage-associated protein
VTDWRLQKAYFLSEVWSIEERLKRLSAVDFASWTHGPWSLHVREATEALESTMIVRRETQPARRRSEAEFLSVPEPEEVPAMSNEEYEFLDMVAAQIRFLDGESLTKTAKATPPYVASRARQLIDLDGYLETLRRKHSRLAASQKVAALIAEAKAE